MDLGELLSLTSLVFCLTVWVVVWLQRKVIAMLWKKAEENKYYRELMLPLGPPATGGLIAAFVKLYPFPEAFAGSLSGRVFLGAVLGLLSGFVYRIVKKMLAKKEVEAGDAEVEDLLGGDK